MAFFLVKNEGVVHELTVTTGIDHDTIHELYEFLCPWFFTGAAAPNLDRPCLSTTCCMLKGGILPVAMNQASSTRWGFAFEVADHSIIVNNALVNSPLSRRHFSTRLVEFHHVQLLNNK